MRDSSRKAGRSGSQKAVIEPPPPAKGSKKSSKQGKPNKKEPDVCVSCGKELTAAMTALFVEEEIGRIFCSEKCITQYFKDPISQMEKDYFDHLAEDDLDPDEREKYAHLRWITLKEPDEIWVETVDSGDRYYSLISEYQVDGRRIQSVCVTLFLRGEPSFLFMAFITQDAALVEHFRRGERLHWTTPDEQRSMASESYSRGGAEEEAPENLAYDGLADDWTDDEVVLTQLRDRRSAEDIPLEEFALYDDLLEGTLKGPDQVWLVSQTKPGQQQPDEDFDESDHYYHFIKHYSEEDPELWYIVIARETDEDDQIEILAAFPTRDPNLVEHYRTGKLEVSSHEGSPTEDDSSPMIH